MPILAFPVILFLGHMLNGLPQWKNGAKEGGIIALVVMFASLILSIWVIIEHLNHVGAARIYLGNQCMVGWSDLGHGNQSVWSWHLH